MAAPPVLDFAAVIRPLAALACALLVAGSACSESDPGAESAGAPADGKDATCHEVQRSPNRTCCPAGQFYEFEGNGCAAVGPPECADVVFGDPAACVPRWCWSGQIDEDGACDPVQDDTCEMIGRLCTTEELAAGMGCSAGMAPDRDNPGECVSAGSFAGSGVPKDWNGDLDSLPPVPPLEESIPPGVPPLVALPSLEESVPDGVPPVTKLAAIENSFFCRDDPGAESRFCSESELNVCVRGPDGSLPDPAKCVYVGVPWMSKYCPAGFVVDGAAKAEAGQLPPCQPDPADCGDDPYGDAALTVAGGAVFVNAATGKDDNPGTRAAPLATVKVALAKVPVGGTVALAAGIYNEAVVIEQAVTLRGRCAAMTRIVGAAGEPTVWVLGPNNKGEALISDLRIDGPWYGVKVNSELPARLRRVLVHGASVVGVLAWGANTKVSADGLLVRDTVESSGEVTPARGIDVHFGATVTLHDVRLTANRQLGLRAHGPNTAVEATALLVDSTLEDSKNGLDGVGIFAMNGASLVLHGARLSGNRAAGLVATGAGTAVKATRLAVDGTLPRASDGMFGLGLRIDEGATISMRDIRLSENRTSGLFARGANTTVGATVLVVDHTQPQAKDGEAGHGATFALGVTVTLSDVRLSNNHERGLVVLSAGTRVTAKRLLVDGTRSRPTSKDFGWGVSVTGGAALKLTDARLLENRDCGFVAGGANTEFKATGLLVDGTLPNEDSDGRGCGSEATDGAAVQLENARFTANHTAGIRATGAQTTVKATGLLIDGTLPRASDQQLGLGVFAELAASVSLNDARLSGNRFAGLLSQNANTQVKVTRTLIDGTLPAASDELFGHGLQVKDGAAAVLQDVRLSHNRDMGLSVLGATSTVKATSLVVDNTLSRASNDGEGRGVYVENGPLVRLHDVRVSGNRDMGLFAMGGGTRVEANHLIVDGTLPQLSEKNSGSGVIAQGGATMILRDVRLSRNRTAGLGVFGQSTLVEAMGVMIDGTQPRLSDDDLGYGIATFFGAETRLSGANVVGNHVSGMYTHAATTAVVGGAIRHTVSQAVHDVGGFGIWLDEGASGSFLASIVADNRASAIAAAASEIEVNQIVVHATGWGNSLRRDPNGVYRFSSAVTLGDGVVIDASPASRVERCLFVDNVRAGVLVNDSPNAVVRRNLIDGGGVGLYGLVFQHTTDAIDQHNAVFGAVLSNRSSDAGLSLPLPPKAVGPFAKAEP